MQQWYLRRALLTFSWCISKVLGILKIPEHPIKNTTKSLGGSLAVIPALRRLRQEGGRFVRDMERRWGVGERKG